MYYGQTDWIDVTVVGGKPEAILVAPGREDVDLEARYGADNGMRYWRARVKDPPGQWSVWEQFEPGTVITTEQLHWHDNQFQVDILDELRDAETGLLRFAARGEVRHCEECAQPLSDTGLGPHLRGCKQQRLPGQRLLR